jgi:hypothetical protein
MVDAVGVSQRGVGALEVSIVEGFVEFFRDVRSAEPVLRVCQDVCCECVKACVARLLNPTQISRIKGARAGRWHTSCHLSVRADDMLSSSSRRCCSLRASWMRNSDNALTGGDNAWAVSPPVAQSTPARNGSLPPTGLRGLLLGRVMLLSPSARAGAGAGVGVGVGVGSLTDLRALAEQSLAGARPLRAAAVHSCIHSIRERERERGLIFIFPRKSVWFP